MLSQYFWYTVDIRVNNNLFTDHSDSSVHTCCSGKQSHAKYGPARRWGWVCVLLSTFNWWLGIVCIRFCYNYLAQTVWAVLHNLEENLYGKVAVPILTEELRTVVSNLHVARGHCVRSIRGKRHVPTVCSIALMSACWSLTRIEEQWNWARVVRKIVSTERDDLEPTRREP